MLKAIERRRVSVFLFCLFIFLSLLFLKLEGINSQEPTEQALLDEVLSGFNQIKTIQSDVSFEIERNDDYIFLKGRYSSAPENMYRLEFRPVGNWVKIVSNGKKVWFYIENIRKVYIADLKEGTSAGSNVFTAATMAGRDTISKDFEVSFFKKERKGWTELHIYKAIPKSPHEFVSSVLFWINPQIKVIQRIETYDLHENISSIMIFDKYRNYGENIWFPTRMVSQSRDGSDVLRNEIKFEKVKINQRLEESRFVFVIPEKTTIEHVDLEKYRGEELIKKE